MTYKQRTIESKEGSHVTIWGKGNPRRGKGKCKGPGAGMFLEHSRNREERMGGKRGLRERAGLGLLLSETGL